MIFLECANSEPNTVFIKWLNPATLKVTAPDSILPGASSGIEIQGTLYNEASFIS